MDSGEPRDRERPPRDGDHRQRRPSGPPSPSRLGDRGRIAPVGPPEPWAGPGRVDDGRRRKGTVAARYAGWGDDVERVTCARLAPAPPAAFPVHSRAGTATLPIRLVAARPGSVLLCDGSHAGSHLWAEGEPASADELAAPASDARRPITPPVLPVQLATDGATAPPPAGDPDP